MTDWNQNMTLPFATGRSHFQTQHQPQPHEKNETKQTDLNAEIPNTEHAQKTHTIITTVNEVNDLRVAES